MVLKQSFSIHHGARTGFNMDAGYPCRHDEVRIFISVGERKIMEQFVVVYSASNAEIRIKYQQREARN